MYMYLYRLLCQSTPQPALTQHCWSIGHWSGSEVKMQAHSSRDWLLLMSASSRSKCHNTACCWMHRLIILLWCTLLILYSLILYLSTGFSLSLSLSLSQLLPSFSSPLSIWCSLLFHCRDASCMMSSFTILVMMSFYLSVMSKLLVKLLSTSKNTLSDQRCYILHPNVYVHVQTQWSKVFEHYCGKVVLNCEVDIHIILYVYSTILTTRFTCYEGSLCLTLIIMLTSSCACKTTILCSGWNDFSMIEIFHMLYLFICMNTLHNIINCDVLL